jgi:hypothetical protein
VDLDAHVRSWPHIGIEIRCGRSLVMGRALALVPIPVTIGVPAVIAPGLILFVGRAIGQHRSVRRVASRMFAGRFGAGTVHATIVARVLGWTWMDSIRARFGMPPAEPIGGTSW